MMLTPSDLEDFAARFSLTEGTIAAREDIHRIAVEQAEEGMRLVLDLAPARFHGLLSRRRVMTGRTSCGLCGIEDLATLPRAGQRRGASGQACGHTAGAGRLGSAPSAEPGDAGRACRRLGCAGWHDHLRAVGCRPAQRAGPAGWRGADPRRQPRRRLPAGHQPMLVRDGREGRCVKGGYAGGDFGPDLAGCRARPTPWHHPGRRRPA